MFDTPADATDPGPAGPGSAYQAEVTAMPGQRLNFATMFVQSNDLFFAPAGEGITLFDEDDQPLEEQDVSLDVALWDAGTEVNQAPRLGPVQAPRQSEPGAGAPEGDRSIRLAADDPVWSYPAVDDLIMVTVRPM